MEKNCNHNIESEDTTLCESPKRFLIRPDIRDCFCLNCRKYIRFQRNSEGNFSLVTE